MNGNQKGCFAEYHFATTAIKQGFNVSMPLLDSSMYDCILEKNGKLFKFQVKYLGAERYKHGRSIRTNYLNTFLPAVISSNSWKHNHIKKNQKKCFV